MTDKAYYEKGFDIVSARERFFGKREMCERYVIRFLEDPNYEEMIKAIREKDTEQAFHYAHTLKGVCANLSLWRMQDAVSGVVEYCIGVSAGSANVCSYIAGQKGRNYQFYTDYSFRKEYMSVKNLFQKGSYINMDYIYGELSNTGGENPLDYKKIEESDVELRVVATNAVTGKPVYFDKTDMCQDNYSIMKASCCIPLVCKPYRIKGVPYYDGGLSDPIPVQKALDDGCDKVVVILTKPIDTIRVAKKDAFPARVLKRKYPKSGEDLARRYKTYNDQVRLAKKYQKQGKVLILAPDDCCGMETLTKDKSALDKMYHKGYRDAKKIPDFVK